MSQLTFQSTPAITLDALPRFDSTLSVAEAYQALGTVGGGAFLYSQGGQDYMVRADALMEQVLANTDREAIRRVMRRPLSEAVGDAAGQVVLPIVRQFEGKGDIESEAGETVVLVRSDGGLGVARGSPALLSPAVERLWYICARGHENPDPDHGTCYRCPAGIVKVESR